MPTRSRRDIGRIFLDGTPIDRALDEAIREAVRRHKLLGHPIIVWRDGKAVWVAPDELSLEEPEGDDRKR